MGRCAASGRCRDESPLGEYQPVYAPAEVARLRRYLAEGDGWRPRDSCKMVGLIAVRLGTPLVLLVAAVWVLNSC